MKFNERTQTSLTFGFVTLLFIITRFILFNGFNGTDDLHYAMLAARLLKNDYNPFEINDIFSGRILLIALQALIYRLGGISAITTGLGTIIAVIISCWLVVYKLLFKRTPAITCLACSLFYFTPAVIAPMNGVIPDPYIMLSGIAVYLLVNPQATGRQQNFRNNIIAGFLIAITLLIKETILVFLPFAAILQIYYQGKKGWYNTFILGLSFLGTIVLFGVGYHFFAGDAFIKVAQIRNSGYPNPCNFESLPLKDFIIRLTYGVYVKFIQTGFYPVLLGCILLIARFFNWRDVSSRKDPTLVTFCSLLLIALYFPFSLSGYQPLCSSSRQFIFLLPFAIPFVLKFLFAEEKRAVNLTFLALLFILILACVATTDSKWRLVMYVLLFLSFLVSLLVHRKSDLFKSALFSCLLFISIFESKFFNKNQWYRDMSQLSGKLQSSYYYFPEHDNMMHWKLLHDFDETNVHYINLEKYPFKIFKVYYESPDPKSFDPGWFIVNKNYTTLSGQTLHQLDSLQTKWDHPKQVRINDINATFIETKEQLHEVDSILKK